MLPVLPGFSGQVPQGLAALHPESKFSRQLWQNFDSNYSGVFLLEPTDQLFVEIGRLFIQEQTKVQQVPVC
jgi:alpha-N-acetylglucosaminidase